MEQPTRTKDAPGRTRLPGGGRKRKCTQLKSRAVDIATLFESNTDGTDIQPIEWTLKGLQRLTQELQEKGCAISPRTMRDFLGRNHYYSHHNRNLPKGMTNDDVTGQFRYVDRRVQEALGRGNPVVFLHAASRNLHGSEQYAREEFSRYCPREIASINEDLDDTLIAPNGYLYKLRSSEEKEDVRRKKRDATIIPLQRLVTEREAAIMAAVALRHWWNVEGRNIFPDKKEIYLPMFLESSKAFCLDTWKWEIRRLSNELGMRILVSHIQPGTWRWREQKHELFSFTSKAGGKKPKKGFLVIASLIAPKDIPCHRINSIPAMFDHRRYPMGKRVVKERTMRGLNLVPDDFHGEWNYSFTPSDK